MIHAQVNPPIIRCKYDSLEPLDTLVPHPRNRNIHPKEQIERLADAFQYQGIRKPIVISNQSGFITAGHGRLLAAKELGMDTFPVEYQEYESEEQEYRDVVADNAIALWAELDLEEIKRDASEIQIKDLSTLAIKQFCLPTPTADKFNGDPDSIPEVKESVCKTGQLWQLGEHRLLVGDCTVKENVERLMDGEKADMVFTDPPYNVASETSCFDSTSETRTKSMGKLKDAEWDKNFDPLTVFPSFELAMGDDCTLYWCTSHHLAPAIWAWQKMWATHSNYCVWSKPNPMPSLSKRHWTWNTELVCYATKGKHTFNFPNGTHALSTWQIMKSAKCDLHPTMKPVELIEHALKHSSEGGHLIVDLFLGSGSTLIACEKTGRKCYGMEIDPHYCDVIIKRWQDFTGKMAVRIDA